MAQLGVSSGATATRPGRTTLAVLLCFAYPIGAGRGAGMSILFTVICMILVLVAGTLGRAAGSGAPQLALFAGAAVIFCFAALHAARKI